MRWGRRPLLSHQYVFYVVTSPTLGRVKIGVSFGDERRRLEVHRQASYVEVVRVCRDLPDAEKLERHVLSTLRDADIPPVQGREYFDVMALPVVLDIVDGWTGTAA